MELKLSKWKLKSENILVDACVPGDITNTAKIEQKDANTIAVTIKANAFAKSVFINMPNNYKCTYTDNYIDLEAGEEKIVVITCPDAISASDVCISDLVSEK